MGQTVISAELIRQRFSPRSVESVALCAKDDVNLRLLLEVIGGCKVVVMPPDPVDNPAPNSALEPTLASLARLSAKALEGQEQEHEYHHPQELHGLRRGGGAAAVTR